ncbi:hypothetical protein [Saccharophagus degradans]|uniref:Uncharacterized protein n=1 Tax=Saccharophagus degradans TaxID=86304 RepID=A0AAW7X035_9GAMM|nr:hypothetical protein [Saccharophagus degradans]MDO6421146.1 hypothetical protein [Saccharophagus degradans]MDO6605943.1 hypothetical protein [Saccharophagus degradans]
MWDGIRKIVKELPIQIKICFIDGSESDYSKWINFPSEGYGDIKSFGPFRLSEVSKVKIDVVEDRKLGRLLKEKKISHAKEVGNYLGKEKIVFEEKGGVFIVEVGLSGQT